MNDTKEIPYYFSKRVWEDILPLMTGFNLIYSLLLMSPTILSSCSQEEAVPVDADFTFIVVDNDYSVPVKVKISNLTVGADSYHWSFEGADRTHSTDRNPGTLVYNNPGTYKIRLDAGNADGSQQSKAFEISLDTAVEIGFNTAFEINNFAPAIVDIVNTTKGATTYQWIFEGGSPATSDQEQPGNVVFAEPGDHTIKLTVGNGREMHEMDKRLSVGPKLSKDFGWEIAFQDDDLQIPVTLSLQNKSIGALDYNWTFTAGQPSSSLLENPTVVFNEPGMHTLALSVSNGKETQTLTKTIEVFANTNLRLFENVHFGINTAHKANTTGAYFSASTREVYNKVEAETINGDIIDLVFFGLDEDFSFNKFVSPDQISDATFETLPNANHTVIVNSQEQCECSTLLSDEQFDTMVDDSILRDLIIEETDGGLQHFTNAMVPRIILFQTADGRKGAVKIKDYLINGQNSYILTDIKVQKESR